MAEQVAFHERRRGQKPVPSSDQRRMQRRQCLQLVAIERRRLLTEGFMQGLRQERVSYLEKRRSPRKELTIRVIFRSMGTSLEGYVKDIGLGGISIISDILPMVGEPVSLNFSFSKNIVFMDIPGVIVSLRKRKEVRYPYDIGIEFASMGEVERRILAACIVELIKDHEKAIDASAKVPEEAHLSEVVRTLSAHSEAWAKCSPAVLDCLLSETILACRDHFNDLLKIIVRETDCAVSSGLAGTFTLLSRALLEYRLAFRHLQVGKRPPLNFDTLGGRRVMPFYPHPEIGCDPWLLPGARGVIVLKKGVSEEDVREAQAERYFSPHFSRGVALALTPFNSAGVGFQMAFELLLEKRLPTILKVSEKTPEVGEVFEKTLAPFIQAGVLRIVQGGPRVGEILLRQPGIAQVHLVGKLQTAQKIRAILSKEVLLATEVGGLTPIILDPRLTRPMDILSAAWQIDYMSNDNNGQNCIAGQIVFAPEGIAERLAAALSEIYKSKRYGEPLARGGGYDHTCTLGPVIDEEAVHRYWRLRQDAEKHGMKVICHGTPRGRLVPPTLIVGRFDPERLIVREEAYLPLVAIMTVPAEDARVYRERIMMVLQDLAASGGLGAAYLTPSPSDPFAMDFYLNLPYGVIGVNIWPGVICPYGPWGAFGLTRRSGDYFHRNRRMMGDNQAEKVLFIFPSPGRHGWGRLRLWQAPWHPPTNQWTTGFLRNVVDTYLQLGAGDQWQSLMSLGRAFSCATMREITTYPQRAAVGARFMLP